jgi:hypothetical protein
MESFLTDFFSFADSLLSDVLGPYYNKVDNKVDKKPLQLPIEMPIFFLYKNTEIPLYNIYV